MVNKSFYSGLSAGCVLFDRFSLLRCIEASSGGGVFLCEDHYQDMKKIVLKVYETSKPTKRDSGSIVLKQELQMSLMVNHPNVLMGELYFQDQEWTALTLPYMSGGTLRQRIEHERIPIVETVDILHQIANGLTAIHRSGLVHRDIKPENILLDENGTVHIADFGVAEKETTLKRTSGEVLIGTIDYLCPEYVCNGYCDRGTDIYALGAIGYEMLCGELPWCDTTRFESIASGARHTITPVRHIREDCPKLLSDLISRALSPKRKDRHLTTIKTASQLRRIKKKLEAQGKSQNSTETLHNRMLKILKNPLQLFEDLVPYELFH